MTIPNLDSIVLTRTQRTLLAGLLLLASLFTLNACQPSKIPPITQPVSATATTSQSLLPETTETETPIPPTITPANFAYLVRITDENDLPLARAHVLIEVQGAAYFDAYADNKGYIREFFKPTQDDQPARLIVEVEGFRSHRQEIDLRSSQLPKLIILQRIGTPTPTPTPTLFVPGAEGETLVVIADFLDQSGNDPDRLTQNLVDEVRETLDNYPKIRVERLMRAIPGEHGNELAMQIGEGADINTNIIIWGDYVGTDREPQAHIHFNIVKPVSTYLSNSFYERYGPSQIAEQPSMFDFTTSIATQLGQVTAFIAAVTLYNTNEHLVAEPLFTTAIRVANQPIVAKFARAIRYYRAANYWFLGRFLEAKPEIDRLQPRQALSIDTIDELDLPILNLLGLVYAALGEKQQALDFYNQALPLRRAVGDKAGEATTLHNIGGVYADLGEKQQALDYYNQALPVLRAVGDKGGEAATLNNIGSVYYSQGDLKKALEHTIDAGDILHEIGDAWTEVTALNNIAFLQFQLNDFDAAMESVETAITVAKKLDHPDLPQLEALLAEINAQRKK